MEPTVWKTNTDALKEWVARHMPSLDDEFVGMTMKGVCIRLNEITGLALRVTSDLETRHAAAFLAVLKAQAGGDVERVMAEVRAQVATAKTVPPEVMHAAPVVPAQTARAAGARRTKAVTP